KAVMLDEKADAGVDQENQYVFEGDFEVLEEGAE
ncbi:recombinase RecT, partial [Pseudomonas sp. C2L11]|nr:recombinase RecT [Pseudomonas typographi]